MLKDVFGSRMIGRNRFYDLMNKQHLTLKPINKRHTTNSNHNYRKYKNQIKGFKPTMPNQLWVADITYIMTEDKVCYGHFITDAFTHEIIGYVISDTLASTCTIEALRQAILAAGDIDLSGTIHHSDRGSQYCCNNYVALLNDMHMTISMTEDYKPTDNAIAERVNGIIKQEWLYKMKLPKDLEDAKRLLDGIVYFYNNKRPHMSIGMRTPVQMRKEFYANKHSLWASCLKP